MRAPRLAAPRGAARTRRGRLRGLAQRGCGGGLTPVRAAGRYEGEWRENDFHGHGTFTSRSGGWSFTGTLARDRPVAGVLTEAGGRRFEVKYAGDCALMHLNPTPSSKVAQPQVLGDLQPPFLPALCKNSRTAQECTHNLPKNNALNEHTECTHFFVIVTRQPLPNMHSRTQRKNAHTHARHTQRMTRTES